MPRHILPTSLLETCINRSPGKRRKRRLKTRAIDPRSLTRAHSLPKLPKLPIIPNTTFRSLRAKRQQKRQKKKKAKELQQVKKADPGSGDQPTVPSSDRMLGSSASMPLLTGKHKQGVRPSLHRSPQWKPVVFYDSKLNLWTHLEIENRKRLEEPRQRSRKHEEEDIPMSKLQEYKAVKAREELLQRRQWRSDNREQILQAYEDMLMKRRNREAKRMLRKHIVSSTALADFAKVLWRQQQMAADKETRMKKDLKDLNDNEKALLEKWSGQKIESRGKGVLDEYRLHRSAETYTEVTIMEYADVANTELIGVPVWELHTLTPQEAQQLFDKFDTNHTFRLGHNQLVKLITSLAHLYFDTESRLGMGLKKDSDETATEYLLSVREYEKQLDWMAKKLIEVMDVDRDGHICRAEFITTWNAYAIALFADFQKYKKLRKGNADNTESSLPQAKHLQGQGVRALDRQYKGNKAGQPQKGSLAHL